MMKKAGFKSYYLATLSHRLKWINVCAWSNDSSETRKFLGNPEAAMVFR